MEQAKWYVLHTFSGYENVAKENLETVRDKFNLQDRIFDIIIPMEEVMEEKNGKKKSCDSLIYRMRTEAWQILKPLRPYIFRIQRKIKKILG